MSFARFFSLPRASRRSKGLSKSRAKPFRPEFEGLEDRRVPATLMVTTLQDETTNAATLSLREAITQANNQAGDDMITFSSGLSGTIQLATSLPAMTSNIAIQGPGASSLSVNRNTTTANFAIFTVAGAHTVSLSGMTISNGKGLSGAGIGNLGGVLTVTGCVVSGNLATGDTSTGEGGGGILNQAGSTLALVNSTVSNNTSIGNGGGIYNAGTLTVVGSTFSNNDADGGYGGGFYSLSGVVTLSSSTFALNNASFGGGGFFTDGSSVTARNVTVASNTLSNPSPGAGIYVDGGTVTLHNTLVALNNTPAFPNEFGRSRRDISGAISPFSLNNLVGDGTNMTGISNGVNGNKVGSNVGSFDPGFSGGLANNGGLTATYALSSASIAVNAGSNAQAPDTSPTATDQRGAGFDRKRGGTVDIGAFEYNTNSPPVITSYTDAPVIQEGGTLTLAVQAISDADDDACTFTWDLNNDGLFGDATGSSVTLTWQQLIALGIKDNGAYTMKVKADDGHGGISPAYNVALTVQNTAPTAAINGVLTSNPEGTPISLTSSVSDPSPTDSFTYFWSVAKNGTTYGAASNASSYTFTPNDNGSYVVSLKVKDDDGGSTTVTKTITVTNVAPTPLINGVPSDNTSPEGTAISLSGAATDPGSLDTVTYAWTVTKNSQFFVGGTGASFIFTPNDNGSYLVTLKATDNNSDSATTSKTIIVTNVAPNVALTNPPSAGNEGSPVNFAATSSDPGANEAIVYNWIVTKNSQPFTTGQGSSFSFTPDNEGSYGVSVVAVDKDGASSSPVSTTVAVADVLPTFSIGGVPSSSPQGTAINATALVGTDPNPSDKNDLTWSVKNVATNEILATGTVTAFAFTPMVPGEYLVTLTITNADVATQSSTSQSLTVTNVAPKDLAISGPLSSLMGVKVGFAGTYADPGANDTHTVGWSVSNSAGRVVASSTASPFSFTPTLAGTYTVKFTAADNRGGTTSVTRVLNVLSAGYKPDATTPGKTALYIFGTTGNDTITVAPANTTGGLFVTVNGKLQGTFAPNGRIIVDAMGSNDSVTFVSRTINRTVVQVGQSAILMGGDGNDKLNVSGSKAANVLSGGAGNDVLTGGAGRDLLFGGFGTDTLTGAAGDDLEVGGRTAFDANMAGMAALLSEWNRTSHTYAQRLAAIRNGGGLNGSYRLNAANVVDDGLADVMIGNQGIDAFFAGQRRGKDVLRDKARNEMTI
jgi:hypothetical protein